VDATGLDISQVNRLIESEQFKTLLALEKDSQITNALQYDDGWDYAENLALSKVIENLQSIPDPEYALKVASLANKASRRSNVHKNNPIVPIANLQAVINLNPTFVQKLQKTFEVSERKLENLEQKTVNLLNPKGVKNLLQPKEEMEETADLLMNAFSFGAS